MQPRVDIGSQAARFQRLVAGAALRASGLCNTLEIPGRRFALPYNLANETQEALWDLLASLRRHLADHCDPRHWGGQQSSSEQPP